MTQPSFARRPVSQKLLLRAAQLCVVEMGVKWNQVISTSRAHAGVVWARQVAQFVCREYLGATFEQLGVAFHRDHSAVSYSCRTVAGFLEVYPELRPEVEALRIKVEKLTPGVRVIRLIQRAA